MKLIDLVDLGTDFAPRRCKRRVATLFFLVALVSPAIAMKPLLWYANEKAADVRDRMVNLMIPDLPPPMSPAGDGPKRHHGRHVLPREPRE